MDGEETEDVDDDAEQTEHDGDSGVRLTEELQGALRERQVLAPACAVCVCCQKQVGLRTSSGTMLVVAFDFLLSLHARTSPLRVSQAFLQTFN